MTQQSLDELWRDFSRTAQELEARFATEEACCAYGIARGPLGRQAGPRALLL